MMMTPNSGVELHSEFFIKGFSSCRLTVDVNSIATSYCKAKEYAEFFVSGDQGALVNGCDFHF